LKETSVHEYTIRTRADKVAILPFGDVHYGHVDCDYEKVNKYIEWAKANKDVYLFLMGDLLETDIPIHLTTRGVMWNLDGDKYKPSDQFKDMVKLLRPLKKRIIGAVMGNHEKRIYNLTSISLTEELCNKLGIPFLHPNPVYVRINVGKQSYMFLVAHGSGSSQRADYQIRKAINYYPSSDVVLIGHIHYISGHPYYRLFVDDDGREVMKTIYGVRTGGFLGYPEYAREKLMEPVDTGSPLVYLYSKKKVISVNTSDFVGKI